MKIFVVVSYNDGPEKATSTREDAVEYCKSVMRFWGDNPDEWNHIYYIGEVELLGQEK